MPSVVSPYLAAAGAAWVDGPSVGGWIAERLGEFGPAVDHAVPKGYAAYAVVPIAWDEHEDNAPVVVLDDLYDVLEPFTGEHAVYSGMWDGWGWMYETGGQPNTGGVGVWWDPDGDRPTQEEIERIRAEGRAQVAAEAVECPDADPLRLPHRDYYVWTGPLRSASALRHHAYSRPSLIWPEDRSWFVGAPIYTNEIAIGGPAEVIAAVLADARLNARPTTLDYELDIDD